MIQLPDTVAARFAVDVVKRLRESGYDALLAGGCVRDLLLGRSPKDFDVATSAKPAQVKSLFRRSIAVGESFGVIRALGPDKHDVEIATFRIDGDYSDGRRPDQVTFAAAEQDAARRDFTVNAIFYDPLDKRVIDYVGGLADLNARLVRAVGEPERRFREDRLRMIRAARFAARFGFSLDARTREAIQAQSSRIVEVSAERILTELTAMLVPSTRVEAFRHTIDLGLASVLLPEVVSGDEADPEFVQSALGYWDCEIAPAVAFALLYSRVDRDRVDKGESLRRRLSSLKASNELLERSSWILRRRSSFVDAKSAPIGLIKQTLNHEGSAELLDWCEAIAYSTDRSNERNEATVDPTTSDVRFVREYLAATDPQRVNPPVWVTGNDLISLGYEPGKAFKAILETVRFEQLDERFVDRDAAIARARALADALPVD